MSTREMAYSIFQQMTDEELEGFVALFRNVHPPKIGDNSDKKTAFERLQSMIRPGTHDIDEKKELEEYRKEKYGI